jgi:hypothetical protein
MSEIRVSTVIEATPRKVWAALEDISTHVRWMSDAERITFTSTSRRGVGTTFDCLTRIGPLSLTDRMEVTAWEDAARMGVRHCGVVTGSGEFTLGPRRAGAATELAWAERLRFPWWMGGPVGAVVARPVLRAVWRANLRRLKGLVEGGDLP